MITGTNKVDRFVIKKEKHKVSVLQYRVKKENELVFKREYSLSTIPMKYGFMVWMMMIYSMFPVPKEQE